MDGNAIANRHLALAYRVLSSIEEKKSAKEIWDYLARLYEARSLHDKKILKRKLYALRMTESTSVTEHVNNLNTLFSQLTSLSCIIETQERAGILLQSLPDSYDQFIINLTSNVLSGYLVFDDVAAAILEEENRRNNMEDRQTSSRYCHDHELKIIGIGSIMVKMHDGDVRCTQSRRSLKCLKFSKFTKRGLNLTLERRSSVSGRIMESIKADEQNLVRKSKSNVGKCKLGKIIMAEAVNTACYMINQSSSTAIELKTPMEMWTEKPVNYSDLHIFRSHVGDVVFIEDKIQENEEGDIVTMETTSIHIEKEFQSNDSFKATPRHENNPDASFWKATMQEIEALYKNKMWELMPLPGGPNKDHINKLKAQLAREFKMKDLGPANKILRMKIHQDIVVRSLMFAMICTRLDIAHALGVVSWYIMKPGREHWEAVKRILRYIKVTLDVALCFGDSDLIVKGYVDLITQVRNKREKDKIGTKPDQIKKNEKRGKAGKRIIMALTFADTHNMITYLTKSDASEGFDQIINLFNLSSIKYELTVNPNIYVSCIKQFWSSVSANKVNDVTRLQALIDRKNVIITEATVREALRLDDAKSIDCLPNEEIFTELSRLGYEKPSTKLTFYKAFLSQQWKFLIHTILQCMSAKRTSWNEFSSSIASAVICLSTCQNSIFPSSFLTALAQVGDLSSHTTKYSSPAQTQKVFANMRRVGKGFSGEEIPLYEDMIVAQQADDVTNEVADGVDVDDVPAADVKPTLPLPTPTTQPPPPQQELPSTSHVAPTPLPSPIAQPSSPPQQQQPLQPTHDAEISLDLLYTLLETCTTLTRKFEHLDQDKVALALEITTLKQRVKKLERKNKDDESEPAELKEVVTTAKLMTEVVTVAAATITVATTPITNATITAALSAARRRKLVVIIDQEET
nr:retrovirus-related Pol polyprotein from transposon TNT 1-94 [Tanacetum cinerariifolium]